MRRKFFTVLSAALALSACSTEPQPRVASISVASPVDSILNQGASVQFSATARDSRGGGMNAVFAWESSNPAAASVNGSGLVSALSPGAATVQVTIPTDAAVQGSLAIRVVDADLTTITALTADAFSSSLLGALSASARPAAQAAWASCMSHAADQNVVAIERCVTDLRGQAGAATDGNDRALLATLLVYGDQIERRLAL